MDDFIIWHNDKNYLQTVRIEIEKFLNQKLKLNLKEKTGVRHVYNGVPFLGYRVTINGFLLSQNSKKRFMQKYRYYGNEIIKSSCFDLMIQQRLTALFSYIKHANTWHFRKNLLQRFGDISTGTNRVIRGGRWGSVGIYCRSAFRNWGHPSNRCRDMGFRVVLAPSSVLKDREQWSETAELEAEGARQPPGD